MIAVLVLLVSVLPNYAIVTPTFVESPCPFLVIAPEIEGKTIFCGTLDVPESRTGLSDDVAVLQVVIIKSIAANPGDPIIYFDGGPGGSAVSAVSFWVTSAMRTYADLILFDQRGTGYSVPNLNCVEYDSISYDYDGECYERLKKERIPLEAYTSAESAADVADLIAALDLPSVNLYGISYGSRLALTLMRDHPERIRSVILDGVYPPNINRYDEQAKDAVRVFELTFTECEANRVCNRAYPDLRGTFLNMIDDLNEDPMRGVDDYGDSIDVYGDSVVDDLFDLYYSTVMIPYIPAIIAAAAERDYDRYISLGAVAPNNLASQLENMTDEEFDTYVTHYLSFATVDDYLNYRDSLDDITYLKLVQEIYNQGEEVSLEEQEALNAKLMDITGSETLNDLYIFLNDLTDDEYYALVDRAYGTIDDFSEGIFNTIECYDEIPFSTLKEAANQIADVPPSLAAALLYGIESQFTTCEYWLEQVAGDVETQPVRSDIPTLVMNGQYDPITPPAWGQAAADHLPNSFNYTFPAMGHSVIDWRDFPCPTDIALQFLANPTQEPDTSCMIRMEAPDFFVDG